MNVRQIDNDTWEVNLGAGILPITVTHSDLVFYNTFSGGTMVMPSRSELTRFEKFMDAIAAVNEYLHVQKHAALCLRCGQTMSIAEALSHDKICTG